MHLYAVGYKLRRRSGRRIEEEWKAWWKFRPSGSWNRNWICMHMHQNIKLWCMYLIAFYESKVAIFKIRFTGMFVLKCQNNCSHYQNVQWLLKNTQNLLKVWLLLLFENIKWTCVMNEFIIEKIRCPWNFLCTAWERRIYFLYAGWVNSYFQCSVKN